MDQLAEIVKTTVFWYRADSEKLRMFAFANEEAQAYTVTVVYTPEVKLPAGVVVQARIVGNLVVIDADNTDRPLDKALEREGIPPEKIICAYAGEPMPILQEEPH